MKAVHCPDGCIVYPKLSIVCAPGETLPQALDRRKRQLVAELFHQAAIPADFTEWDFDTFPEDPHKRPTLDAARSYAAQIHRDSLLLIGAARTGKTGLAVCILKARLDQAVPSPFVSVPDLLDKIRATFRGYGDYTQLMEAVKAIDFLVLDDLTAHQRYVSLKERGLGF